MGKGLYGLLFGCLFTATGFAETNLSSAVAIDQPLEITAPRFLRTDDNTFIADGGVTGHFGNVMIRADEMLGNPDTGDLHAKGNIRFERDEMYWQGSNLDYNYISEQGDFGPSQMYFDPVHVSADQVQRVSTNEFKMQQASFTTCPKDKPHFRAVVSDASVFDGQRFKAKGMKVYAGPVPFFYLPYLQFSGGESIFKFRAGYSSDWGAYLQTDTTLPITKSLDSKTEVDLYHKRGVGLGQNLEWDGPNSLGVIGGCYLQDQSPHERHSLSTAPGNMISQDRYRLKAEQLYNFSDEHYLNTKWMYLSDPAVLDEFFKREYRNSAQPENYASWLYGNSMVGTELHANHRLNDFYDNVNRYEYNLDLYRSRLGPLPFYLSSENSVSRLERIFAETNTNMAPDYAAARIDSDNMVYMPLRLSFLNVVPRAGYRGTFYSKSATGTGQPEVARGIAQGGVELSFQTAKVLSNRERWYGKGLRHKMEPYADYSYAYTTQSRTNMFYQFDRIDQLGDEHNVKLGLRNILQTKRAGRTSRFIDLDLFTYYRIEDHAVTNSASFPFYTGISTNASGTLYDKDFSYLYIDARMPLAEKVMLDMEGAYDWYEGNIPYFTTRFSLDRTDYIASLEHRYVLDDYSLWTPRVDLFPTRKASIEAYVRYEDRANDLEEIAVIGYYSLCCMRYGLGFHHDGDDHRIMFSIALSAFPDEKISSGF